MTAFLEFGHGAVVGCNTVAIVVELKGSNEDDNANVVVSKHDALVATAGVDGETAHVVGEELADGLYQNVKFIGSGFGKKASDVVEGWIGRLIIGCELGGPNALAGPDEITFDGSAA